jgi:hypothetical protein
VVGILAYSVISIGTAWGFPWNLPAVLLGGFFLGRLLAEREAHNG